MLDGVREGSQFGDVNEPEAVALVERLVACCPPASPRLRILPPPRAGPRLPVDDPRRPRHPDRS
ncbi:hypothetical protein FRACA_60060 [Frankia canadensis]|uniref:Uncharacterized protein n=1 Tax=Frankia canadensis TaxID=1836972 RepID=A0A2I2KZI1_9ACTN|nr:hypothetical protein FRACA_60060 [Frankia canadensis]SOU58364.1 hypothetical protein FRACA_60060 [Frankia canadensis]